VPVALGVHAVCAVEMRSFVVLVLMGSLAWASSACSLNPQPLPPDKPFDAGLGDATSFGGGADAADEDVGTTPVPHDAEAPDAAVDASYDDAASDASDAGDVDGDAGRDDASDAADDGAVAEDGASE
jgi:hypothetical protein